MMKWSTGSIDAAIGEAEQKLELDSLKKKQVEGARSFASNKKHVCFFCLLVMAKSIPYAILPYVFDKLRGKLLLAVSSTA